MGLLEKAYAKNLGHYSRLNRWKEFDFTVQAMRDLSCAPSFNHDDPKGYFSHIKEDLALNYIVSGICTKDGGNLEKDCAYPILQSAEVKGEQLVKLRNPWGKEYQGKWKNTSAEWSTEDRNKLNVLEAEDGTFWAPVTDFTSLQTCEYNDKFVF